MSSVSRWNFHPPYRRTISLEIKKPVPEMAQLVPQHHAGIVQILCLAQKPQRISCGNPVGRIVFRVAVAGDDPIALREGLVHLLDVVFIQQIVCIKHQKGIVILISVILRNAVEGKIQCVSFADLLWIAALIDHSAHLPRDLRGVVVQLSATTKMSTSSRG